MERPQKSGEDASATEIQEYLDAYEVWCEWKVAEMNEKNDS